MLVTLCCVWDSPHTPSLTDLFLVPWISDYTTDPYYAINKQFSPNSARMLEWECFPYHLSNIVKIMFSQPKIQSLRNSPFLPYITAPQPQQVILRLESLSLTVNPFRSEKASFTSSFLFPSENKPDAHDLASNTLPILLLVVLYGLKNLRIPRLFKVAFFSFSSSLIYIQHICIE